MTTYARRVDSNQKEIVQGLRDLSLPVRLLSHCPSGALDFITGYGGILYWVEVKKTDKDELTDHERKTFELFQGYTVVKVTSLDELLEIMGVTRGTETSR